MKKNNSNKNPGNLASRIWSKQTDIWSADAEVQATILNRLGWLDSVDWMLARVDDLLAWTRQLSASNRFDRVVVLGMGGSSLAPEVFSTIFEPVDGFPRLAVLDSTSPDMVEAIRKGDLQRTLFIVASKSGTTLETTDLYRFFFDQLSALSDQPGQNFVAITDQGSWLQAHASEQGFLETFVNPSDIGGRYSALSYFGLVPAALYGVNVKTLLERAKVMVKTTVPDDSQDNPALALGLAMSGHANAGRDKMRLLLPEAMASFGAWVEQLVAESTGKSGVGIVPVCLTYDEETPQLHPEQKDIFEVVVFDREDDTEGSGEQLQLFVGSPLDIGAEFFRWEFATAVAAAGMEINPFDEPNVSEAKRSTNNFIENDRQLSLLQTASTELYSVHAVAEDIVDGDSVRFVNKLSKAGYVAVLAYLPMNPQTVEHIEQLRYQIACYYDVVCTAGFGPRYLHSTGQLHKGGAPTGAFIQIVEQAQHDHAVPGRDYGFARLISAQADGDLSVLSDKGLPVMRFALKGDRLQAIGSLASVYADMA